MNGIYITTCEVYGVDYKNTYGTCHQDILKKCKVGDILKVTRPIKPRKIIHYLMLMIGLGIYRGEDIIVLTNSLKQIGWIISEKVHGLGRYMDIGSEIFATVSEITGGINGKNYGCIIKIFAKSFITEVFNIHKSNIDGIKRQNIIQLCNEGEKLILKRENPNDFKHIGVYTLSGEQIGQIPKDLANLLKNTMDDIPEFNGVINVKKGRNKIRKLLIKIIAEKENN